MLLKDMAIYFLIINKAGERGGGAGRAKYLGPGLVRGARNLGEAIWSWVLMSKGLGPRNA